MPTFKYLGLILIYAIGLDLLLSGVLLILDAVSITDLISLFFIHILIIAIFIYHLPYYLLMVGCKPDRKCYVNLNLKMAVRKYQAYSDPKDLDFENATVNDMVEKKFGFNATNIRYVLVIKNQITSKLVDLKISPWQFDYVFKEKNKCLIALENFIQPINPTYFYLVPWLKFCTFNISIFGRLMYAISALIFIVLYFLFLLIPFRF